MDVDAEMDMNTQRREFLSGERPEDILIYLSEEAVSDVDALSEHGERVSDGIVLVFAGERGRTVFERAVGVKPMAFAGKAMDTEGTISNDCLDGECPNAHSDEPDTETDTDVDHQIRFLLAFAEEQNEEVGGVYAEGDVIHAYAACTCNTMYSDRWVIEKR